MIDYHELISNLTIFKEALAASAALSKTEEARQACEYSIRYINEAVLASIPEPYGYNLEVAEDAPTFKAWRKVAWFAEKPNLFQQAKEHSSWNKGMHRLTSRPVRGDMMDMCTIEGDARADGAIWTPVLRYRMMSLAKPTTIEAKEAGE